MVSPRKRVAGVYAKPILNSTDLRVDPRAVLTRLKRELNRRLKQKLETAVVYPAYSEAAKKRIAQSLQIRIRKNSLIVTTNFPGFFPFVKGQKAHQMTWLTKAPRPIPIVLDSGKVIFRNATWNSMQNQSWWHPGYRPTNFVDKAKKEAKKFLKERLTKEFIRQLRATIGR